MKTGYKTTEFWLTAAATVIGLLWASGVIAPEGTDAIAKAVAFAASALAAMGYSATRSRVKAAEIDLEGTKAMAEGQR